MMGTGVRKSGDFCWINVVTPQPEEAKEFLPGTFDIGENGRMAECFDPNGAKMDLAIRYEPRQ